MDDGGLIGVIASDGGGADKEPRSGDAELPNAPKFFVCVVFRRKISFIVTLYEVEDGSREPDEISFFFLRGPINEARKGKFRVNP